MFFVNLIAFSFLFVLLCMPMLVLLILVDFVKGGRTKRAFVSFMESKYPVMSIENRQALTDRYSRHFIVAGLVWAAIFLAASYTAPQWFFPLFEG